jgi:hypothetical protein
MRSSCLQDGAENLCRQVVDDQALCISADLSYSILCIDLLLRRAFFLLAGWC